MGKPFNYGRRAPLPTPPPSPSPPPTQQPAQQPEPQVDSRQHDRSTGLPIATVDEMVAAHTNVRRTIDTIVIHNITFLQGFAQLPNPASPPGATLQSTRIEMELQRERARALNSHARRFEELTGRVRANLERVLEPDSVIGPPEQEQPEDEPEDRLTQ